MKKWIKKIVIVLAFLVFAHPIGHSEATVIRNSQIENITSESNIEKSVSEITLDVLFLAIYGVESRYDSTAINRKEMAVGGLQIRRILLKDYYQRTGKRVLLYDTIKLTTSKEIFLYYADVYGPSPEKIARCWNGGGRGMEKESTKTYWTKVKQEIETIKKQRS